jgi:hypothetical protein
MRDLIDSGKALEWATAILAFIVPMTMGAYAAHGMNPLQWAGAAAAIMGSITLAVMVRVWPQGKTLAQAFED